MGTSFVEYKDYGFWSRDSYLEGWIRAMVREMEKLPSKEVWMKELIQEWRIQASINGGCITPGLDNILTSPDRIESLLSLAHNALQHTPPNSKRTGELFLQLLRGELKTIDSSPMDYL